MIVYCAYNINENMFLQQQANNANKSNNKLFKCAALFHLLKPKSEWKFFLFCFGGFYDEYCTYLGLGVS